MKSQFGVTLLELTLVVAILGVIGLVLLPGLSATDPAKLDLAASRVAEALRYAHSESIRTGQVHGVLADHNDTESTGMEITVYKVDLAASPFGLERILPHPISKQPYDIAISGNALTPGVTITNTSEVFDIDTLGLKKHIHFNAEGRPVYYQNTVPKRMLSGEIRMGNGRHERTVTLEPVTGRVVVQ